MSTEVQPSQTPAPIFQSPTPPPRSSSWHPSSIFPKHKRNKSPPPAALTTQGERRHRRSSSLGEALSKLKPSNRPERGGTLRLNKEDGQYPLENVGGAERTGGRALDQPGPTTLANGWRHVQAGLAVDGADNGKGKSGGPRHNFEHPTLAGASGHASWSLDRSQRERATASFACERDPRDFPVRSSERQVADYDTRALESGRGGGSASKGITTAYTSTSLSRAVNPAYERLATDTSFSTRLGNGSHGPAGISSYGRENGHGEYTDGLEGGNGSCGRQGEGKETTVHGIAAETTRPRTEMDEAGSAGKPGHGSGRGNGLRKLLGSWGKKTNRERSSGSPETDRLRKPLPALPLMAQGDLGFRISIPGFSEDKQNTPAQQMFEDKKVRREQRRSIKESGDYLGVQGANPRTGYWDVSSSSEPSQMSEETKRKLDEEAREVAERKRRYEEAEMKHRVELERVQTMRENKKKMEKKMKQRRRGKWQLSENGWSSVAEPDLSPIIQSVVGTPVIGKP
ncbi:hypothetical protein ACEPPN_015472 [Leptodophora sp. 'Broadleaf-Isolate-01']